MGRSIRQDGRVTESTAFAHARALVWGKLLLGDAEQRATSYSAADANRIRSLSRSANLRVRAARDLTAPAMQPIVVGLYRDAIRFRLLAFRIGRSQSPGPCVDEAIVQDPTADAVERMSPDECEELTRSLIKLEQRLRSETEPRDVVAIRATRYGRLAAVIVLILYGLGRVIAHAMGPPNVALHRHVTTSEGTEVAALVDGDGDKKRPVHTSGAFIIDLGGVYSISSVRLTNRTDAHLDASLPLRVDVAEREGAWQELAIQRMHFRKVEIDGQRRRAQYVRVSTKAQELDLNQVEVLGWYAGR